MRDSWLDLVHSVLVRVLYATLGVVFATFTLFLYLIPSRPSR